MIKEDEVADAENIAGYEPTSKGQGGNNKDNCRDMFFGVVIPFGYVITVALAMGAKLFVVAIS